MWVGMGVWVYGWVGGWMDGWMGMWEGGRVHACILLKSVGVSG